MENLQHRNLHPINVKNPFFSSCFSDYAGLIFVSMLCLYGCARLNSYSVVIFTFVYVVAGLWLRRLWEIFIWVLWMRPLVVLWVETKTRNKWIIFMCVCIDFSE